MRAFLNYRARCRTRPLFYNHLPNSLHTAQTPHPLLTLPSMKPVLLALLATCASVLTAQTTLNIDIDNDFSGFEYLDKVPDSVRVFLAGENHAYRNFNNEIKEKTLRYLRAHRDVRLWISEMGAGRAYLINQGLIHGDSTMFDLMSDFSWEEDVEIGRAHV